MAQKVWSLQSEKHRRDEKKELVENMPEFLSNAQVCETCQQGKQTKLPFQQIKYEELTRNFSLFKRMFAAQ